MYPTHFRAELRNALSEIFSSIDREYEIAAEAYEKEQARTPLVQQRIYWSAGILTSLFLLYCILAGMGALVDLSMRGKD